MSDNPQTVVNGNDCNSYKNIKNYPCGDQIAGQPCKYNKVLNDCLPPSLLTLKHNKNSCSKYFLVDDAYPGKDGNCLSRVGIVPSGCEPKCSIENFEKNCGYFSPDLVCSDARRAKQPNWCYRPN